MNRILLGWLLCVGLLCGACGGDKNQPQKGTENDRFAVYADGKTLTTSGLQRLIDECAQKGGGVVSIPAGKYLTGTLRLRNNVTLHLEKGAKLIGSKNATDYPEQGRRKALVFAEKVNNIAITGEGEIDGSGAAFNKGNDAPNRPTLILLQDCKNVKVDSVRLSNSAFWTFRFVRCDGVDINRVYVEGHANWNNDGFDIESRNVTISDCVLDTDDDAICFKSEDPDFVVENVTVKNCDLSSNCNFIKFGTASAGGFRNIRVYDCNLHKCSKSLLRFWEKIVPGVTDPITGIAGMALEVVDGGFMEDVIISNIDMKDVQTPIFIRLGRRKASENSYLKNVTIKNITGTTASHIASSITGVPGLRVENVCIQDVNLQLKGGGKLADTRVDVPEKEDAYPENRMFGVMLPAYGFYIRHADNIHLKNVTLSTFGNPEERYAIVADDVTQLSFTDCHLQKPSSGLPIVHLIDSQDVTMPDSWR